MDDNYVWEDGTTINYGACLGHGVCKEESMMGMVFTMCDCCGSGTACLDSTGTYVGATFSGQYCSTTTTYYKAQIQIGFKETGDSPEVTCDVTPTDDAVTDPDKNPDTWPYMQEQIQTILTAHGYFGTIMPAQCERCSSAYPCALLSGSPDSATDMIYGTYQSDYNSYYDPDCNSELAFEDDPTFNSCPQNTDYGLSAYEAWIAVDWDGFLSDFGNTIVAQQHSGLVVGPTDETVYICTLDTSIDVGYVNGLYTQDMCLDMKNIWPSVVVNNVDLEIQAVAALTLPPTAYPTTEEVAPTDMPTRTPPAPDGEPACSRFINSVNDLKFKGVGVNCRAGIQDDWPGGRTCESPYVVCLPQENTPWNATELFGDVLDAGASWDQPNYDDQHMYSVDECKEECAWDQRCLGFEFLADNSFESLDRTRGWCNLIDDIPVEVYNDMTDGYVYTGLEDDLTVWNEDINNVALCFAKEEYCNPYFQASDLNEVMTSCYCPNNRKGYYTKKVERIPDNTHHCSDPTKDDQIKKAQANRMFHLCENWCLFDTEYPNEESWYYDPWEKCWREQYAGHGTNHRTYCYKVIRDPYTIEMQFLNYRRDNFCTDDGAELPISPFPNEGGSWLEVQTRATPAPIDRGEITWHVGAEYDTCEETCATETDLSGNPAMCDENAMNTVVNGMPHAEVMQYFALAQTLCGSVEDGSYGHALPALHAETMTCVSRDPSTVNTHCDVSIGVGYLRLCSCATLVYT